MKQGGLDRRGFMRGSAAALAVGSVGSVVIGCGSEPTDSGRTPVDFLAILDPEGLTFAPELLGIAGGYFADVGLDVTLQQTRGSAPAIQSVIAGGAPLTRIEQIEGMGHLVSRNVPIVNVGTVIKESSIRFVSSESDPILQPEDFIGKLIGIPSEGGSSDKTLDLVLSAADIDPESIERQVVGPGAGVYDLVERGQIAAYAVSIDTANILDVQRGNVATLNPGDFIVSGAQFYMASRQGLIDHADTLRRYLEATQAAIEFMIDDEGFEQTLATLRQQYSFATLLDTEIAVKSLTEYVRIWTAEGRENIMRTLDSSWQRGYEELVEVGLAEGGHDPSAWYTNELVAEG